MTEFWYYISQLWVATFFNGIYLVLFCICIYILLHRPRSRGNIVLLVAAIALFTLSTIIVILALILGAARIDDVDLPVPELLFAANIIFGVNNVIADGLVIYRCYCVWNYNGYVVIGYGKSDAVCRGLTRTDAALTRTGAALPRRYG
ncbi:hypothetical protein C8F04DRAFT_1106741 [Mycena alexandri]|uniref:Uncharacterized protein n=1 Tax=Mycena alexandri TaxID=1745969 RepID=A0AAD6SSH9_9AGAR|nr:hypothetical protein C8F04DRAFT_1106741 [Mycena alexandri]